MPETKRLLKVFLCHAHSDRNAVRDLYLRLTKDSVDAWLDKEKLLPGEDWERAIRRAVRESDVVVVCLSRQFNQAGFRQKEVRLALDTAMQQPEGEIFIIPARLEECDTLESLRKWHWVDLFVDDGYEMLRRALPARTNKIGTVLQGTESPRSKNPTTPKTQWKPNTAIIVALIGFVGTIIAGLLGSPLIERWISTAPVPTNSATATERIESSLTSTGFLISQELVTPSATSTEIATATPTLSPTKTLPPGITPTFTPVLTNTPDVPASGFTLISINKTAYIGGKAKAQIRTQPGTQCSLVFYLPSGKISSAPGVGNITADQDGYCTWTWSILGNVNPGYGTAVIIAGGQKTNYYIKIE